MSFRNLPEDVRNAMLTPFHNILPASPSSGALYLGSLSALLDDSVDELRSLNVSVLVQALDFSCLLLTEEDGFTLYRIDIKDLPTQRLDTTLLEAACDYIDEMRGSGKSVLVHCQQGVSRSASIVIAYLIRKNRWSYREAFAFVKGKRACVQPNLGFAACLRSWDEQQNGAQ